MDAPGGLLKSGKVIVVMPAYNAERTVALTVRSLPPGCADEIILVDDASQDRTVEVARALGLRVIVRESNAGYGANQKTCYREALRRGADYIVMVHPDYQYDPRVVPAMVHILRCDICDVILGNRIRTRREALCCGMPRYKYWSNRLLTLVENIALGQNLGEFHSGLRAYTRRVLETVPFENNADDFLFDTELLVQAVRFGFRLGDVPVPVRYGGDASSINFVSSVRYGLGTLATVAKFWVDRLGLYQPRIFQSPCVPQEG